MRGISVVMICHFPPPVHGAALVSERVRQQLVADGHMVRSINTSPGRLQRGATYYLARIRSLIGLIDLLKLRRGTVVYCAVNAGRGAIIDIIAAAAARAAGCVIYLHHHSFSYLHQWSYLHHLLWEVSGASAMHIVLCGRMKQQLRTAYGIDDRRIMTVSNTNFVPIAEVSPCLAQPEGGVVRIGFMSNIMEEKGIDVFLDVASRTLDLNAVFCVAGQIADKKYDWLKETKNGDGNVEWRGPVFGDSKEAYLREIDILLFPSKYRNEAEPLVLYEAMAAGVIVVAYDRGCIRDVVLPPHVIAGDPGEMESAVRRLAGKRPPRAAIRAEYRRTKERRASRIFGDDLDPCD